MSLQDSLATLRAAVEDLKTAISAELEELKTKFADFVTKIDALENTDLSADVAAITDSIAKVQALSDADVPVTPDEPVEPTPEFGRRRF